MNIEKLTLEIGRRLHARGWCVLNGCESGVPLNVEQCDALYQAVKSAVACVSEQPEAVNGVPLWDWYAGMALQGILSGPTAEPHLNYTGDAIDYANKMMEARKARK